MAILPCLLFAFSFCNRSFANRQSTYLVLHFIFLSLTYSSCLFQQNSWAPRLTPRVNQLRAEECADVSNTREVAHEREVHTAMQMGQSCEDLTLVAGLQNSPTRLNR